MSDDEINIPVAEVRGETACVSPSNENQQQYKSIIEDYRYYLYYSEEMFNERQARIYQRPI